MKGQAQGRSASFQGDSPASLFPLPGSGEAGKMDATSGRNYQRAPANLGCWRKCCWNRQDGTRRYFI